LPKERKRLKQSLLGHFMFVRSYEAAEFDLLDQKYVDVQNAAKEDTELSMNYEREDEGGRLVTELADLLRPPRPQGVFDGSSEAYCLSAA
jgi:hypothetical protein